MSGYEKHKMDLELKAFASTYFEKPGRCRDLEQIRFYVSELCWKIEEYEQTFSYVPSSAYALLAQYNARQNSLLYQDFIKTY